MSRLSLRTSIVLVALAAAGLAACDKQGSAPTGFGVNVTVDATSLSMAERAKIKSGTLRALSDKAGATIVTSTVDKFGDAVQGGTVRFHYTPASSVKAGETLTLVLEAMGSGSAMVASGSDSVELKEAAVDAKIKLTGTGDAGMSGDGAEGGGKKGNGTACLEGTECDSGFCADGVCCNEKCDDVCVSCKLPDSKGMCTPYAMDTDPEMECAAKLPPVPPEDDAGAAPATDGSSGDAGGDAASEAGVAIPAPSDGGAAEVAESDAAVINQPDGGFMSMPAKCGGACGGGRSCKYPGTTTSCGKAFCNSHREIGSFVCDGQGGCNIQLSGCTDYACDDSVGACRTKCTAHSDCQPGNYCDGPSHTCGPKNGLGLKCTTDDECKSGHCASNVCCNTACTGAGLSCNDPGKVPGQCSCMGVTCAAGVACQIFYQDLDNDTFGNRNGSLTANPPTAKAGCMGMTPPAGFVVDNTDCDDTDANAHPGQTMFFAVQRKGGGFDFDCDDKTTKETPEYVGGTCRLCGPVGSCDAATSCSASGQTASFVCPQELAIFTRLDQSIAPMSIDPHITVPRTPLMPPTLTPPTGTQAAAEPGAALPPGGGIILPPKLPQCCGCAASDKTGFRQAVPCGDSSVPAWTCGSCSSATGPLSGMTQSFKQQRCH
jgi:hypothetical protein